MTRIISASARDASAAKDYGCGNGDGYGDSCGDGNGCGCGNAIGKLHGKGSCGNGSALRSTRRHRYGAWGNRTAAGVLLLVILLLLLEICVTSTVASYLMPAESNLGWDTPPRGAPLAIDNLGRVYILDKSCTIYQYAPNGTELNIIKLRSTCHYLHLILYVDDEYNFFIKPYSYDSFVKLNTTGSVVTKFSFTLRQSDTIMAITTDRNGDILATSLELVLRFASNGTLLATQNTSSSYEWPDSQPPRIPSGAFTDILDCFKWRSFGDYLFVLYNNSNSLVKFDQQGVLLLHISLEIYTTDMAIDSDDNIYLASGDGVFKFNSSGSLVQNWTNLPQEEWNGTTTVLYDNYFYRFAYQLFKHDITNNFKIVQDIHSKYINVRPIEHITMDHTGTRMYISQDNKLMSRISGEGLVQRQTYYYDQFHLNYFLAHPINNTIYGGDRLYLYIFNSTFDVERNLSNPFEGTESSPIIAFDQEGHLYVPAYASNGYNRTIRIYDNVVVNQTSYHSVLLQMNEDDYRLTFRNDTKGLWVDSHRNIFVSYSSYPCVWKFTETGIFSAKFNLSTFNITIKCGFIISTISGVTTDLSDNIYIASQCGIHVLNSNGEYFTSLYGIREPNSSSYGELYIPDSLFVHSNGTVFAGTNGRIFVFDPISNNSSNGSDNKTVIIIGSVIGGVALVLALCMAYYYCYCRRYAHNRFALKTAKHDNYQTIPAHRSDVEFNDGI